MASFLLFYWGMSQEHIERFLGKLLTDKDFFKEIRLFGGTNTHCLAPSFLLYSGVFYLLLSKLKRVTL